MTEFGNKVVKIAKYVANQMNQKDATEKFVETRESLGKVLDLYSEQKYDSEVIERALSLTRDLEVLQENELSKSDFARSRTNVVVASARTRRTHYAAYMAGKLSEKDTLGDQFKNWINNSAADAAFSVAELLDRASRFVNKESDSQEHVISLMKIFRDGAIYDAHRFVESSRAYDQGSILTYYNAAKLDIFSKSKELRDKGIEDLVGIPIIDAENDVSVSAPELCWHVNNYDSFLVHDNAVKEIIGIQSPENLKIIKHNLERNRNAALEIKAKRGDIWKESTSGNKVAAAVFTSGAALVTFAAAEPEIVTSVFEVIAEASEHVLAYLNTDAARAITDEAVKTSLGDGGLAEAFDVAMSGTYRASFGDGGLA